MNGNDTRNREHKVDETTMHEPSKKKAITRKIGKSLKVKVLSRVFSEDYESAKNRILDPTGQTLHQWNKTFLVACLFSLFLDPIFLYIPIIRGSQLCVDGAITLQTILTVIRSVADVFYVIQIFFRFHTAYIAPSSRVLGRGELVIDSSKIALKYLRNGFWIDLTTALPLPQVLVWFIIPNTEGWATFHAYDLIWFIIVIQYMARLYHVFPPLSQLLEETGVVTKTALRAAAYNYWIFLLAGHIFGAVWYILSIQRQEDCWHWVCNNETSYNCPQKFFDCRNVEDPNRVNWFQSSNVTYQCNPINNLYPFGIMNFAYMYQVQETTFLRKFFFCFWWGLKNMRKLELRDREKAHEFYLEVKSEVEKCLAFLKEKRENDPYRNLLARLAYQATHGYNSEVPTFEI